MNDAYKKTLDRLFGLQMMGVKLGLENIRRFCDRLGNPQNELEVFHVAGSNGKGSVSSFLASMLLEAGYDVGLYTSPHYVRFNERIRVNGVEIDDEFLVDFYRKHESFIVENKLTFFEVTTAMAFQYFYEAEVDYAVLETGLGGRLDATNVVAEPLAAIVTSVSKEHTHILGDDIKQIATEKSAIVKPSANVFEGRLPVEASEVLEARCEETGCELFRVDDYTIKRDDYLEFYSEEMSIGRLESALPGEYQRYNAALAALAIHKTLHLVDPAIFQRGAKRVTSNAGAWGRYEIVSERPRMILDSAHNAEGVVNFLTEFRNEMREYDRRILLFGAMRDKALDLMLKELAPFFDKILLTRVDNPRAASYEELAAIAKRVDTPAKPIRDYLGFVEYFLDQRKNICLVALGSVYLVGEIKKRLKDQHAFERTA
jgi:dihydrofolate synthase / folylpolyglutamate synthase